MSDIIQYANKSLLVNKKSNIIIGLTMNPAGTNLYVIDDQHDKVDQFSLSEAEDVSSGAYLNQSSAFTPQSSGPRCIFSKPDGTKMYMLFSDSYVRRYSLTSPWSISSFAYDGNANRSPLLTQLSHGDGLWFKSDGTIMYVSDGTNKIIYQYALSQPWFPSTASYTTSLDVSSVCNPMKICFDSTGTILYISDRGFIYKYTLSTAWEITTGDYSGDSADLSGMSLRMRDVFLSSDDSKMYIYAPGDVTVYQYDVL